MMTKGGGGQKSQKFDDVFYERPPFTMHSIMGGGEHIVGIVNPKGGGGLLHNHVHLCIVSKNLHQ